MTTEHVVSAREAARMLGRSERTVRRWIERGQIGGAYQDRASGQYRVPVAAVAALGGTHAASPESEARASAQLAAERAAWPTRSTVAPAVGGVDLVEWQRRAIEAETRLTIARQLVDLLLTESSDLRKELLTVLGA